MTLQAFFKIKLLMSLFLDLMFSNPLFHPVRAEAFEGFI